MRVELSQLPAIDVAGREVLPARRSYEILLTSEDREALARAAEALSQAPESFPLDEEAVRAVTLAVEAVQLVGGAKPPEAATSDRS